MSGCNPGLWVHKDSAVNTDIVRVLLDELLPPGALYVIFKLYTKITIIPGICETSIDL